MLCKTKKTLASFLSLSMVFSMATTGMTAYAETADLADSTVKVSFSDDSNHWASREIGSWSQKGVINGYEDGTFKPDVPISRAEFVSVVNRVFAYSSESAQRFPDVASSAWYAKDLSRAAAAGIVAGDDKGNFNPDAQISRQEAAVVLARAFDLKAKDPKASDRFSDAGAIASWSKEYVNALTEGGYVTGRENGRFDPLASITRAEFVKMMDSVAGELKSAAGTYTGDVSSNLVINTKDVTLKDMNISGDLFITPGVGEGNVSLEHVTVKGRTVVRGGGEHSIVIDNSKLAGTLLVQKYDGKVRILMQGTSEIPYVELISGAILETADTNGKGFGTVQVVGTKTAEQPVKLSGQFNQVAIEAPGVTVQLTKGSIDTIDVQEKAVGSSVRMLDGNVGQLNVWTKALIELLGGKVTGIGIQKSAAGTSVQMASGSTVTKFQIDAPVEIKGPGKIETALINADDVKIESKPTNVVVADGVKTDLNTPAAAGGTSSRRSSGNPILSRTAAMVAESITAITPPLKDVTALALPTVPPGFAVAIKTSSNPGVIALDGSIVPPKEETTVRLVLEVTRLLDNTKADTASLEVVVPAKSVVQQTAAEVAKSITSIAAPAQDAAVLTLPIVPPGFAVAVKSTSDPSVIALDGTIVPPAAQTTVNLVLEVTRLSDNTKADTASLEVVVPAKSIVQQTAADVAKSITSIAAPPQDAAVLTLPTVPPGFAVAIKSSSDPNVIALDGTVMPPAAQTMVNLVLEVTRLSDNTKADTASLEVVVPVKSAPTDIQLKGGDYNYINDITDGVIHITSGNTYIYTVDTAEGAGLTTLTVNTVEELLNQITAKTSAAQSYAVKGANGQAKSMTDPVAQGDVLTVTAGQAARDYTVNFIKGALRGKMELVQNTITADTPSDVVLNFFAGMRSPATEVVLKVPQGVGVTMDNTSVNVIGRGKVKLSELATQSIGRTGAGYRFQQVGTVTIDHQEDGSQVLNFKGLDFRPANGADLEITFEGVNLKQGGYTFEASYTTSEPEVLKSPTGTVSLTVVSTISNFNRVLDKSLTYKETSDTYTKAKFSWSAAKHASSIKLMQSTDKGTTWTESPFAVNAQGEEVEVTNLTPNTEYYFKLAVNGGENTGDSNIAKFYTGKFNAKLMGAKGDGKADDTQAINDAIMYLNSLGGGTLLFENGTFNVRTVHLQSNVYLYIHKDATIAALKGGDAPETTYFSDKGYRSGTSPTATGPYKDPENYLTKQDVGHHYFRNSMFFGERLDNIKIIGNGKITGNGNLVTGDGVMDNAPDNRTDKMVTVKLCTNFEFGGLDNGLDLWYEETNNPTKDEPYYIQSINPDGTNEVRLTDISNMLRVDRAGHFAMLATGTDYINTHDFYYDKGSGGGARDVFDYMQSSYVTAKNIYAKGTSDDIVKPGSDSSLGFTRPATTFYVRNIIGDTNCNLFQIGSETVDDIKNVYVDNIYVLAGNKAGFSISTNDGGHIENIYLNYGMTGPVHHKSEMRRTRAPFFISISNRGRVIGGDAKRMKFMENGVQRDELLSTNVNIGQVRNVFIKDVNIEEVYGGSQYGDPSKRWVKYTNQNKATPIIAGYKVGEGGPVLPDGRNIGYIENLHFENVTLLVKGGNSLADSEISPPELGVGKYNVADIGEQPSYGFWARHVDGLTLTNVTTNFEKNDDRYAIVLDDVKNAAIDQTKMVSGTGNPNVIQLKNASNISITNSSYYKDVWGNNLTALADVNNVTVSTKQTYPNTRVQDPHNTSIQLKLAGHPNLTSLDKINNSITAALGTTVADIVAQVESTDETTQTYAVVDSSNKAKPSGMLETGDFLVVTAQDGTTVKKYSIVVPLEITVRGETQLNSVKKSIAGISLSTSSTNGITYLQTNAVPVGEWIEFSIPVPAAGTYRVSYQYKTNTAGRATVQAYVNGNAAGSPVNQNSATANVFTPADLGQVTFGAAGSYPVRFVATSAGSIVIDYIKFAKESEAGPSSNTNIQLAANHPNVTAIDNDAMIVKVASNTTVADLKAQIVSSDGSVQTYSVNDAASAEKVSGLLAAGDTLVITAMDGKTRMTYAIQAAQAAGSNTNIALNAGSTTIAAIHNTDRRIATSGTATPVASIPGQLKSTDGTAQTYTITNAAGGAPKTNVINGDRLIVTAEDGTTAAYVLTINALPSSTYVQARAAGHPHVATVYNSSRSVIANAGITAAQLLAEIESSDGLNQTYSVTDAVYTVKTGSTPLVTGDLLKVTSQDASANAYYKVQIVDVLYDIDPAGSYTTSNNNTKSTGADDTAGNHDRNSAWNSTHLQVNFGAANQYIEFTINVAASGTYDVLFGSKNSNGNRAAMQLTVDGTNVGSVSETVSSSAAQGMYLAKVGSAALAAGSHTFRFTVAGAASGQSFDFIGLAKTN
ncbi:hypothetical protein GCM10023310_21680 [Paenibacillus vulneris]|uniref:S-layer homology domain-containing protein n=1 Tax=Paenibacillus vulneris TaxID=1133364 RepID=A0ABW3UV16_9BACL